MSGSPAKADNSARDKERLKSSKVQRKKRKTGDGRSETKDVAEVFRPP